MPVPTITQVITAMPPVPNRATDTRTNYANKAATYVDGQVLNATQMETLRGQLNAAIASINAGTLSNGLQTIPISAAALIPNITNGPAIGTLETTTNKVMLRTLDFDPNTQQSAQISIPMPKSWDLGTVTAQFIWAAPGGTAASGVVWGIQGVCSGDGDNYDVAFGTAVTVIDTIIANTNIMETSFTGAVTFAGPPAAEDLLFLRIYRDAAAGSDTCAVNAKLIAVRLKYNVNAGTDA